MSKMWRGLAAALLLSTAGVAGAQPAPAPASDTVATATVRGDTPGPVYDRRIFTQFAEHLGTGIYSGLWVGGNSRIPNTRGFRNDVVSALRNLAVPVVRWPGGCFADEYLWREGIGPRAKRPVKINTHWGGVTEPNTVGTHEFMDLTEQLGTEAYVAGNVGNGTPQETAEWIEYMTSPAGSLADERARNGRLLDRAGRGAGPASRHPDVERPRALGGGRSGDHHAARLGDCIRSRCQQPVGARYQLRQQPVAALLFRFDIRLEPFGDRPAHQRDA
jgi:hypothetical protein